LFRNISRRISNGTFRLRRVQPFRYSSDAFVVLRRPTDECLLKEEERKKWFGSKNIIKDKTSAVSRGRLYEEQTVGFLRSLRFTLEGCGQRDIR